MRRSLGAPPPRAGPAHPAARRHLRGDRRRQGPAAPRAERDGAPRCILAHADGTCERVQCDQRKVATLLGGALTRLGLPVSVDGTAHDIQWLPPGTGGRTDGGLYRPTGKGFVLFDTTSGLELESYGSPDFHDVNHAQVLLDGHAEGGRVEPDVVRRVVDAGAARRAERGGWGV